MSNETLDLAATPSNIGAISATTTEFTDSLIKLADGNITTDTLDIGFWGEYNDGDVAYSGLVRDATDGVFKFFTSSTEPGNTTATIDNGELPDVQANAFIAMSDVTIGRATPDAAPGSLYLYDASGTYFTILTTTTQSAEITYTLPANDGDASQFLQTNGSGTLSWAAASGSGELTEHANGTDNLVTAGLTGGNPAGNALQAGSTYNVLIGSGAGDLITTGDDNICIGRDAGNTLTTGTYAIMIGFDSDTALGTSDAIAIGNGSNAMGNNCITFGSGGHASDTGVDNIFIGKAAGQSGATTGAYNVAIGTQSGLNLLGGAENVCIGYAAGDTITTASDCIMIGYEADCTATDWNQIGIGNTVSCAGAASICIGLNASSLAGNGVAIGPNANVADGVSIGNGAGASLNSSGVDNVVIGPAAMDAASDVSQTIAIGTGALGGMAGVQSTGNTKNMAIGYQALLVADCAVVDAQNFANTAIGYQAGVAVTIGSSNTLIGSTVAGSLTTGNNNVIIGKSSGAAIASGNATVCIGSAANIGGAISNAIAIGNTALAYGAGSIAMGNVVGNTGDSGARNIMIGDNCAVTGVTTGGDNTLIGYLSGEQIAGGADNVAIGTLSDRVTTSGSGNISIGKSSRPAVGSYSNSTQVGGQAQAGVRGAAYGWSARCNGDDGVSIGSNSGHVNDHADSDFNINIGMYSGGGIAYTATAVSNVAIGYYAGNDIEAGARNVFIGFQTGPQTGGASALAGDDNTCIGASSGTSITTTATDNTCVGMNSGLALTTGSTNTFLGANAGATVTTGATNVCIGTAADSGSAISNAIAIGNGATATAADAVSIGRTVTNAVASSINIGLNSIHTGGIQLSNVVTAQDGIVIQTTNSSAISGVRTLALIDSGCTFSIAQSSAYAITLPAATEGVVYRFVVISAGSFNVTIGTDSGSNHLYGNIVNDVTSVLPINAQDTLTFVSGTAAIGDTVEIYGIDSTHWMTRAISSTAGGITVSVT